MEIAFVIAALALPLAAFYFWARGLIKTRRDDLHDYLIIMTAWADQNAVAQIPNRPMQPTIQGTEGRPLWVAVAPHDTVRGYVGDGRGSAFSQGCCLQCGLPRGERTNEPLKVEEIPRGSQGFEVFVDSQIPNAMCCGCSRQVFSEDFLALLT